MSDVIAEETTTLPEGAHVSVYKLRTSRKGGGLTITVKLRAYFDNKTIDMRVDDISAHSLKQYLELIVREITRRRDMLHAKPSIDYRSPKSINEFVLSMAHNGMFMLDDTTGVTKAL